MPPCRHRGPTIAANVMQDSVVLRDVTRLEEELKGSISGRDAVNIQLLRQSLKEKYTNVLLSDPTASAGNDIDRRLWKFCFYMHIEELRQRARLLAAKRGEEKRSAVAGGGTQRSAVKDELANAMRLLRSLLYEGIGFYTNLLGKLRRRYDLPLEEGDVEYDVMGVPLGPGSGAFNALRHASDMDIDAADGADKDLALIVYRCYVFLGDLARYLQQHCDGNKDYASARDYYRKACHLNYSAGNAHNQLAMIAGLVNDELAALYSYCRALAAAEPFDKAQGNLQSLLAKTGARVQPSVALFLRPLLQENTPMKKADAVAERAKALPLLVTAFIRMHALILCDTRDWRPDMAAFMSALRASLKNGLLTDDHVQTMLVINMFAVAVVQATINDANGKAVSLLPGQAPYAEVHIAMAVDFSFSFAAAVTAAMAQLAAKTAKRAPLPYCNGLKLFCDWMRGNETSWAPWPSQVHKTSFPSQLASLFNSILKIYPKLSVPVVLALGQEWKQPSFMPEDLEIRGFLPLERATLHIDYESEAHATSVVYLRMYCMLGFGVWLAACGVPLLRQTETTMKGGVKGIKFAGNNSASRVTQPGTAFAAKTADPDASGASAATSQQTQASSMSDHGELEDEVIVYQAGKNGAEQELSVADMSFHSPDNQRFVSYNSVYGSLHPLSIAQSSSGQPSPIMQAPVQPEAGGAAADSSAAPPTAPHPYRPFGFGAPWLDPSRSVSASIINSIVAAEKNRNEAVGDLPTVSARNVSPIGQRSSASKENEEHKGDGSAAFSETEANGGYFSLWGTNADTAVTGFSPLLSQPPQLRLHNDGLGVLGAHGTDGDPSEASHTTSEQVPVHGNAGQQGPPGSQQSFAWRDANSSAIT